MLWAFIPIAALVTITPGASTAMIIRHALRGGARAGLMTIAGNSIGVITWALLSVLGISALVAASQAAFVALKVVGAVVLVWLGVGSLRRARAGLPATTLLMAALIVAFDVLWYGALAYAVSRAKRAFARTRLARWTEAVTGTVLVALGVRVALERP